MIYIVMGVAGVGKTVVGRALAQALGVPFLEGDELHAAANIEKMAHGTPLNDADRAPWLAAIRLRLEQATGAGQSLVVACSALKQRYRDALDHDLAVHWVYLQGSVELLQRRLEQRQGHYMKANMLDSQLADLEPPSPDRAQIVDAGLPIADIVAAVVSGDNRGR